MSAFSNNYAKVRWTSRRLFGKALADNLFHGEAPAMPVIYKIVSEATWQQARAEGVFHGASIDLADGYIHFSTASQARNTAALHFAGQTGLLLVAVDTEMLGEPLKFEPSRGGDLFPHLYAPLAMTSILWEKPLPIGPDGAHLFPEML
jgi:uncharacterized protein (DUF952 family)